MDRLKLVCCGLLAVQFLFFMWLLSLLVVDGRVSDQKFNGNILIFELFLAGAMISGAIYLRIIQLQSITRK